MLPRLPLIILAQCFVSLPLLAASARHPHQVLVRFAHDLSLFDARGLIFFEGMSVERELVPRLDIFLLGLDPELHVESAIDQLRRHPDVLWAQADHVTEDRLLPNDSEFPQLWNLQQASDADIDAPEAWDLGTGGLDALGRELVVAVVDGGMELTHPDLVANAWINAGEIPGNLLDDDGNGFVDDVNGWDAYNNDGTLPANGHGTHVSGIVGARGNNITQVVGVNWDVRLMSVAGSSSLTSVVSVAYNYVLEQKSLWLETGGLQGANIVATNSSFGVNFGNCSAGDYPVWNDLYNAMGQVGILSAAATMNTNANVDLQGDVPTSCSSDWLITVTNTTSMDLRNAGAAYGLTTIDLGAPGTQVRSTYLGGSTAALTGTSMASPHLAGAVAMLHSVLSDSLFALVQADPAAGALVIKELILANVDSLDALAGLTVSGGRLNLHKASLAATQWPPQPAVLLTITRQADSRMKLDWESMAEATAYYVEAQADPQAPWQRVATVQVPTWTSEAITPNARACYRVIAERP